MARLNPALLCLSLVLAFAASSNANAFHRRDHADLGRLMKKRAPTDTSAVQSSAQTAPTSSVAQSSQGSSAPTQSTDSVSVQMTSASASTGLSISVPLLSGLLPTGSSATPSSVLTTSPSPSHSSGLPQSSAQASDNADRSAQPPAQSILYLTTSSTPTPTQTSSTSPSSSGMSHTAMTILIVIAASIGASVIVWTIIRKWKFRPSTDFEGRMQPIDWQPGGDGDGAALPGQRRLSRASSFHSGSVSGHADDQMRGPVGGYGASVLDPIPDHDFTAGPTHLAPVGGYADLARGPGPHTMMHETLNRSPSINRPIQYDQYGLPLHHGY